MQFHEKINLIYLISRVFLPGLFKIFGPPLWNCKTSFYLDIIQFIGGLGKEQGLGGWRHFGPAKNDGGPILSVLPIKWAITLAIFFSFTFSLMCSKADWRFFIVCTILLWETFGKKSFNFLLRPSQCPKSRKIVIKIGCYGQFQQCRINLSLVVV